MATLEAAARLGGGEVEVKHNYGAWRPNLDSEVLRLAAAAYERVLGEKADRHGSARRPRERRHRRQGRPGARHDLVRAADRVPALARRAREHPDGRTLLEAARRLLDELSKPEGGRRMRGWWIVGAIAAGVVAVLLVSAAVAGGDHSGESVRASSWADDVCGTVGAWEGQLEAIGDDVELNNIGARQNDGGSGDHVEGVPYVRSAIDRVIDATDQTLQEGLTRAGIPDTASAARSLARLHRLGADDRERARRRQGGPRGRPEHHGSRLRRAGRGSSGARALRHRRP